MTRNELLVLVTRGLNADLVDYGELKKLLEAQFDAALHHQSARLAELADTIVSLTETIDGRRRERMELVGALLEGDPEPSMDKVFALLPEKPSRMLQEWWSELENLARDCKAQNARACSLIMDQHEIMQRVLNGEADIYVPA